MNALKLVLGSALGVLLAGALVYRRVMWPPILETGAGDRRIACVGDSITYSLGVLGSRKRWSFPALVAEGMGQEYRAVNYGLSDRTLLSSADRPYFREKVGKLAWDCRGDILIFMLGSNDCKRKNWDAARFRAEYLAAVEHYRSQGFRQMVVMIPPRIFYKEPGKTGYDDRILREELAPVVREAARQFGTVCVDLYALTREHPEWFPDRLHPNKAGNQAIAREILAVLKD